jgi:predicted ribonuclease toxin of YeeF-YezG toxin-antitoxin module
MKDYQTFKKQQAEARKIEQEMEELENRPWYEKAWDTTKTFTGEFTGYYDSIRASTGVDPVTGRKLSDAERIAAGAMAAAGFIPVVGWAGRAIKGGSALYKTAKGLNAANHALDAYKTTKGFSLLQKTEYGIYGLLAANGLGEAATGKDMFGNQLTEEQRQNGLLMALSIVGVAGAAKVADKVASGTKFVPYSKEFAQKQVQKAKAFGRQIGNVEVPLRIRVEELATAYGNNYKHVTFDKTTIKDIVQKSAVKSDGGKGTGMLYHVQRISEIDVMFKQNPKHNAEEFARQLKDQEKGLNDLTIEEYLKNRERYIEEGRALEGNAAQKLARKEALKEKVLELRKQGLSRQDANKKANEWLETQAALHNPDQIAGGNPINIGGMGDKKVNSSIGSQWKYRIDVLDEQIRELSKTMVESERKSTYLNVKLMN